MTAHVLETEAPVAGPNRRPAGRQAVDRLAAPHTTNWLCACERQIIQHPAAALAAALSMGVFFGWLIKRQ